MQLRPYASTFEETFAQPVGTYVVPYSGGLDSTYVLHRLQQGRPDARRIAVHLRWCDTPNDEAAQWAARFGADYIEHDGRPEFFRDFALPAIQHDALYLNRFPISSSLTRPLIARTVAQAWSFAGGGAIVHSATHMQNTARRFERSWAALAPAAPVCAPYIASSLSRSDKAKALAPFGFHAGEHLYSVDATPVARVIENGSLEDPANVLPTAGVFHWTRDIADAPNEPVEVDITFVEGTPLALDSRGLGLQAMFEELNAVGGLHGIGRSSGLEETAFNVKNHEVREAPGLVILIAAHQAIENATLTAEELLIKQHIDQRWTATVAAGGWYDDLASAYAAFSTRLELLVNGRVRLALHKGNISTRRVSSSNTLSYMAFQHVYEALVASRGAGLMANTRDLPVLMRRGQEHETCPEAMHAVSARDRHAGNVR